MSQRQQLYDGKAKTIFAGPDDDHLIQYFKDDATAYNALKHDVIAGKGIPEQPDFGTYHGSCGS